MREVVIRELVPCQATRHCVHQQPWIKRRSVLRLVSWRARVLSWKPATLLAEAQRGWCRRIAMAALTRRAGAGINLALAPDVRLFTTVAVY